jgi:cupin superfamily acireductone dioxygenase involved in methionine salvage
MKQTRKFVVWCTVPHWIEVEAHSRAEAVRIAEESDGGWCPEPDVSDVFSGTRVGVQVEEI